MHTSKEYRQTAWSAIKPVLPIMLLIFSWRAFRSLSSCLSKLPSG